MMFAYLNHGRWVAGCECGGAEMLHPHGGFRYDQDGDPFGLTRDGRLACGSCGVESLVAWPDEATVEALSRLMAPRKPKNRNWLPGEALDSVVADNIEHGLEAA